MYTYPRHRIPPEILLNIARGVLTIDVNTACQLASVSRQLQWIVFEAAKSHWIRRSEIQIQYEPNCRHTLPTEKPHSIPATVYAVNENGTFSLYFTYPHKSSNRILKEIFKTFRDDGTSADSDDVDFELLENLLVHLPHLEMEDSVNKAVTLAATQKLTRKLFSFLRQPSMCSKRWIPGVFRHPTRPALRIRYPFSKDTRNFIHKYGAVANGSRNTFCSTEEYWIKTGRGRWEMIGFWCHDLSLQKVVSLLGQRRNPPLYDSWTYALHRTKLMSVL